MKKIQGALVPELLIGDPIKWQKNKEVKKKNKKKTAEVLGRWFGLVF